MKDKVPSKKIRVFDIVNGRFVSKGNNQYLITPLGEKVSRVNVLGSVTEKYDSPNGKYSSITVDDGTGAVRVKTFGKSTSDLDCTKIGDMVVVFGNVNEYQGETYIYLDSLNTVPEKDRNYENLKRMEVLEDLIKRKDIVDNIRLMKSKVPEEKLVKYAEKNGIDQESMEFIMEKEVDYKPDILKIMEELDEGKGIEILKVFEKSDLEDSIIERTVDDLLSEGYIFEPHPGKFKVIKG